MPDQHKPADTTTYTGIAPILAGRGNLGLAPNKRYTSDTFVLVCNFAHHQRVWFGLNARQKAVLHTNQYTLFNSILEWRLFRKQVCVVPMHAPASKKTDVVEWCAGACI